MRKRRVLFILLTSLIACSALPANAKDDCVLNSCIGADIEGNALKIGLEEREHAVAESSEPEPAPVVDSDFVSEPVSSVKKMVVLPTGDNLSCAYFHVNGGDLRTCVGHPSEKVEGEDKPGEELSSEELMYSALTRVQIDGAGLVINPQKRVFAGLPMLVYASTPVVHRSVELLGRRVEVEFIAREFEYDFHNGRSPLVTSDAGRPYPDKSLFQVYEEPQDGAFVTLRTKWSAQVWLPDTGESMIVSGALETVEESVRFNVTKPKTRLVLPGTKPQ